MTTLAYVALGVLIVGVLISLVWRRCSLPCPAWLSWLVEFDTPFIANNRASVIVHHLDLRPGMKVLDVGCGPGRLTIPIAKQLTPEGEVTAMDIQPAMLRRTREKVDAANLSNVRFLLAGAGEGKTEHSKYDRALMVTVLGEIPDRQSALREIFDALTSGGMLSITELILDPHFQSRDTVVRLATAAGFRAQGFWGNRLAFTLNFAKPFPGARKAD
jgi:2-polyprenyl-3-methyl-5-hydroxy-6-metoxy-1,4-benzoquinol methylase